jgi:putative CocE/NonD family hydrolase
MFLHRIVAITVFALFLAAFSNPSFASGKSKKSTVEKVSSFGLYEGYSIPEYKGFDYTSLYLTMRDSVMLATDIFLPKKLEEGKKIPTIVYLNRYVRSLKAKFPFSILKHPVLTVVSEEEIKFFTSHGYACVIVDTRGSGASTGIREMEFSKEEVKDGAEVVDWIISQPWSSGNVGSTGISYLGTTAELLLVNKHPNVKACIPRSNIFDLYNHIMFPGGVRQGCFVDIWGFTTRSLDNNDFAPFGKQAKNLISSINPVMGDKKKVMLNEALNCHKNNFNVYKGIKEVDFRDEKHPGMFSSPDEFSIHHYRKEIEASGTPIFRIGGWYDGILAKSCVEGFLNTINTKRVMIGPWDHGPHYNASPFASTKEITFNINAEMLRFFDFYLKGIKNGIDKEEPFNYFSIGEEKWKTSTVWPPKNVEEVKYFLSADNTLQHIAEDVKEGLLNYKVNYHASSGNTSRYNSVTALYMNGPTDYPDRKEVSAQLLNFTTKPFEEDVVLTGHPVVDIFWSANANDATIFAYVEEVQPDGKVVYVTEGTMRPMHRKVVATDYKYPGPFHSYKQEDALPYNAGETVQLSFDCAPISYQFKKGSSLRISIAGADIQHFDLPKEIPTEFNVTVSNAMPSSVTLPLIKEKVF